MLSKYIKVETTKIVKEKNLETQQNIKPFRKDKIDPKFFFNGSYLS